MPLQQMYPDINFYHYIPIIESKQTGRSSLISTNYHSLNEQNCIR